MPLDVVELRSFYHSPLGEMTRRLVGRILRQRFSNCAGFSVLGIGYATPYLAVYRPEAVRVLAFMPAEQGVVNWPSSGQSASALVDTNMLPLPDACIDRVIAIHALEGTDHPPELLAEIWRILTPGGRLLIVAPSRSGLWARLDTTPFGHGRPYSRTQLNQLMRDTWFSPTHWTEALYSPPFQKRFFLRAAPAIERIGAALSLPGAGLLVIEAMKQLYSPVAAKRVEPLRQKWVPILQPTTPISPMSKFPMPDLAQDRSG
jgi:SAM-dependent methyltransferase